MTATTLLRLGRVSNLPTVWSNVLAGSALSGGMAFGDLAMVLVAMSALYMSGMMLNDAFDYSIDMRERPERPLPAGEIQPSTVWKLGFSLLATGAALLTTFGFSSAVTAVALVGTILLYDAWHKGNPVSPVIMGACRALVYVGTVLAAGAVLSVPIVVAALALLAFVAGLTAAAKGGAFQSLATSWPTALLAAPIVVALAQGQPAATTLLLAAAATGGLAWAIMGIKSDRSDDREAAIGLLVALIAIVDALVASAHGSVAIALVCVALFLLTVSLQRLFSGT